ncbi:hypothetical protein SteCoe_3631 [Stentor coeruleus]|uniref:PAS domain-containing protein n=1 Tax=Stentor coeruleus TaxID=5963 RepID=A0A1R2CWK3_9CILI|nr:hypothetical protein SteCoe_3631 [Stentor coeruleus]
MDQEITSSESLIIGEKTDFDSNLIRNLNLAKKSRMKKILFKTYHLLSTSWGNDRFYTFRSICTHFGVIIKQCQLLLLTLLERNQTSDTKYDNIIQEFLDFFMIDRFSLNSGHQDLLSSLTLVLSLSLLFITSFLALQIALKKSFFKEPLAIAVNLISWGLRTVLMIPMIIYISIYIKNFPVVSESYINYYKKTLQFNVTFGILMIISLVTLFLHLLAKVIFHSTNLYTTETPRSRSCSIILFKQQICIFILCLLFVFLGRGYFLIISSIISFYLLKEFTTMQPYYSFYNNLIEAGLWLMLFTSSLLFLLDNFINIDNTSLLCMLFLSPLEYVLLVYYMKRVLNNALVKEIDNPKTFELKLRHVLYRNKEISEEDLEDIQNMFNSVTGMFLEYEFLAIWEHNFVMQGIGDENLAMIKLMKTIFAKKRPKIMKKHKKTFVYWPKIECEYIVYVKTKETKKMNNFKDVALIKYIKDLFIFNKYDKEACFKLLDLIDSYLCSNEISKKNLLEKFCEFFSSTKFKDQLLAKNISKYGNDHHFLEISQGFIDDLLKMSEMSLSLYMGKGKESYMDRIIGNNLEKNIGTIIVSGYPDIIGRIIFANQQAINILSYPSDNILIGQNFIKLIPEPFSALHKNILTKFLLFSYRSQLSRPNIFLVDYYGFAIEIIMDVRSTFYSGIPYFIVEIVEKIPLECSILCSDKGEVFTTSPQLKNMFSEYGQNIENVFPNVMKYMKEGRNEVFLYKERGKVATLRWSQVQIDNKVLFILYFMDESKFAHFMDLSSDRPIMLKKRSFGFNHKPHEEAKEFNKKVTLNKRKVRKSCDFVESQKLAPKDHSKKIESIHKTLLYSHYIVTISLSFLLCGLIIYTNLYINDSYLSILLTDINSFRYKTASLLMRSRSIDLLQYNISSYDTIESYNNSLIESAYLYKESLNNLSNWNSQYKIIDYFKDTKILLWDFENTVGVSSQVTLYQAMFLFIGQMSLFINSEYKNIDYKLYVYRNGFETLQHSINVTVYKCLVSTINHSNDIFYIFEIINGFTPVPWLTICAFCIPFILVIVGINKELWNNINEISKNTFVILRNRVVERIQRMHDIDFAQDYHLNQDRKLVANVWFKYAVKVLIAVGLSMLFYLLIIYVTEQKLKYLIKIRLEHIFFGGLRTLTVKAFIWAREAHLSQLNISYEYIFSQNINIPSSKEQFLKAADEIDYYNKKILQEAKYLKTSRNSFTKYIDFLIGNTCLYTDIISNCSNTIINNGINQALSSYIQDLRYLVNSSILDIENLSHLEYTTDIFEKSLTSGISLYNSVIDELLNEYKNQTIIIACIFLLSNLVLLFFFIQPEILRMKKQLLSLNEFVILFKNANIDRTLFIEDAFL